MRPQLVTNFRTTTARRGVTLIELMIAVGILALLAAISMSALANLEERVKIERTKTIIKRINGAIVERWESYHTRPLPIRMPTNINQQTAALIRLRAIRDLQRMELPERASDITSGYDPANVSSSYTNLAAGLTDTTGTTLAKMQLKVPPSFNRYKRIVTAASSTWATTNQQAECLYMVLSGMRDADSNPLDFLSPSEIGDTDGDGMKEILDGWGQPLYFWRWAPGYLRDFDPSTATVDFRDVLTMQDRGTADPFDPYKADRQNYDPPTSMTSTVPQTDPLQLPFALRPLIVSGGPDKVIDLVFHFERTYADSANPPMNKHYQNNPFPTFTQASIMGDLTEAQPYDFGGDGNGWVDNITNHYLEAP